MCCRCTTTTTLLPRLSSKGGARIRPRQSCGRPPSASKRDCAFKATARSNNGMHPTADTNVVIGSKGSGRRVMPGVRQLQSYRAVEYRVRKFLPQVSSPTALLYLYLIATQVVTGVYLAREAEPPPAFSLLYPLGLLWAVGWWLRRDGRGRGVGWVFDMGLFL